MLKKAVTELLKLHTANKFISQVPAGITDCPTPPLRESHANCSVEYLPCPEKVQVILLFTSIISFTDSNDTSFAGGLGELEESANEVGGGIIDPGNKAVVGIKLEL
jgi:hypothetical protein